MKRFIVAVALFVGGVATAGAGLWLISPPAALVVIGAIVATVGLLMSLQDD